MCLFFGLHGENCPTKEKTGDRSYETPDGPHCTVCSTSDSRAGCPGYPVRPHTFISLSADSRRAVVSYWQKYVHNVLVSRLYKEV